MNSSTAGIDVGATSVKLGLLGEDGVVLYKTEIAVQRDSPTQTLKQCHDMIQNYASQHQLNVTAIGIACPGPLDLNTRSLLQLPNLPNWDNFPIFDEAAKLFALPVAIQNDANAAAFGEYRLGAGVGSRMMVMITMGTGIGGGIVCDGKILSGSVGSAAEIGHISVGSSSRKCPCGKTGCLEVYAGSSGLSREYSRLSGNHDTSVRQIIIEARDSREPARQVMLNAAKKIGAVLGNVATMLNPDCIVIGGGVASCGEFLIAEIGRTTLINTMPSMRNCLRIVPAMLGNDAGFIGAALLASEK